MKKIISFINLYYEYVIGIFTDADNLMISSRIKLLKKLGSKIQSKHKVQRRLTIDASLPLVSIIMPCFNAVTFIEKAIESITKQSYSNWELLLIDDGSIDGTKEIIENISSQNPRIKIFINRNNCGVAYSRNVGLYFALGEFITFHDADDVSHLERIEYQLYELLNNKNKLLAVSKYVRVDSKKRHFIVNTKKKLNHISGMMFRKKIINELGYFKSTNVSEDSEYHERILAVYGKRSRKIIQKILYYANFSTDSLLFSNANVTIKGNKLDYSINEQASSVLDEFRNDHLRIRNGDLSPYQDFKLNSEVTYKN